MTPGVEGGLVRNESLQFTPPRCHPIAAEITFSGSLATVPSSPARIRVFCSWAFGAGWGGFSIFKIIFLTSLGLESGLCSGFKI